MKVKDTSGKPSVIFKSQDNTYLAFVNGYSIAAASFIRTDYFVARTSVELDPVSEVAGVDSDKIFPESYGGCLRVRASVGSGPTPNTPIRFSVVQDGTTR